MEKKRGFYVVYTYEIVYYGLSILVLFLLIYLFGVKTIKDMGEGYSIQGKYSNYYE